MAAAYIHVAWTRAHHTHTLLIQNMAGDKCMQEAKPGLDGTGRHWTGPWATGQGPVVGGKKAGNGTYASPHSQYASNLVGFRLKRCQGQVGFHVLAPAVVLIIIIIIIITIIIIIIIIIIILIIIIIIIIII